MDSNASHGMPLPPPIGAPQCARCGYQLRGATTSCCPECGFVAPDQVSSHQAPPITSASLHCARCGYDLTGATVGGSCSECGYSVASSVRGVTIGNKSCGAATTCLILGILSIVVCMLLGPVAIMFYYHAKAQMSMGGFSESSHGMAKAGLIMGIIGTCIIGLYAVIIALSLMM